MESKAYDVVVIGGGIIGLSTAMQIKLDKYPDWRGAVVEKDHSWATGFWDSTDFYLEPMDLRYVRDL